MIQFGRDLRTAREAKGLTIAQVAQTTRLMSSMVEDLENENFTKIAAPIYGRGFVKLYCEAVGLDPKPYVAEFIEIFSGNKRTEIKERPIAPAAVQPPPPPPPVMPEPAPQPAPQPSPYVPPQPAPQPFAAPAPEPPLVQIPVPQAAPQPPRVTSHALEPEAASVPHQASLFDPPAPPAPPRPVARPVTRPAPAPQPAPQPAPKAPPSAAPKAAPPPPRPGRYVPPHMPERPRFRSSFKINLPKIPLVVWRVGALVVAALVVLWLLMIGLRALYHATTGNPNRPPVAIQTEPLVPAQPAQPAALPPADAKRTTLQNIPALYID